MTNCLSNSINVNEKYPTLFELYMRIKYINYVLFTKFI